MFTNITEHQIRCTKCDKLLAHDHGMAGFEIKCLRCGELNRVFEHMTEQVIVTDANGKIFFINKAFERITGYTAHESIGKRASELWGGQMTKAFYVDMWNRMKTKKESIHVTMTNKKKSGELYDLTLTVSPVLDASGDILFFVGIEVVI